MKALASLTREEAAGLHGLLFDLDDNLLDHGRLGEAAYSALFRLRESGLSLYIVTGRPSGWAEILTRMWPVDGAVAENGAIGIVVRDEHAVVLDPVPAGEREQRSVRLRALVEDLVRRFPELVPAGDVAARRSDFTFDIGETRSVSREVVARAREHARSLGAFTTTSSVHLHVSFDRADKAAGALWLLRERTGIDPTLARSRYAFIGDSENDASCFAAFRTTIGVANLRGKLTVVPRFITSGARGEGFAEAASLLVKLRSGR